MAGALHALVIGISTYPNLEPGHAADDRNFGLQSLSSAALAAYRVGKWLETSGAFARRPLGSLKLMVAPSADELATEPGLGTYATSCSTLAFTKEVAHWRDLVGQNRENVAFFYFAGHGVQRPKRGDHVLLLDDFADGVGARLSKAIDTSKLIDGMAVDDERPDMAREQFYILDACRMAPEEFSRYTSRDSDTAAFWDVPHDTTNEQRAARSAIVIHTATDGDETFGLRGQQSVFSTALIECLDSSAARMREDTDDQPVWEVSLISLIGALTGELERLNETYGTKQQFDSSGIRPDIVLREFPAPPEVELIVEIAPPEASAWTALQLSDEAGNPVRTLPPPLPDNPYRERHPAGYYSARATIEPPNPKYREARKTRLARPRRYRIQLEVGT